MIREVREGEIGWLPGLTLKELPSGLPAGITLHSKAGILGVESQGLVGALPLNGGDTLRILPKVDDINFFRLLFKAGGSQNELRREYDDFVTYGVGDGRNVDAIVARSLFTAAADIIRFSPLRGRILKRRVGTFALGRMDAVATALNVACRKETPIVYEINEKTVDIPENRLILEALIRSWAFLKSNEQEVFRFVRDHWVSHYRRTSDVIFDLEYIENRFAGGEYGGSRDYYRKALMLSRIALGVNGLSFDANKIIEGDAILINTADIFEKYLRNVISEAYTCQGYIVTKAGFPAKSLYVSGHFELEPDIVISKNGKVVLVADAKYKTPSAGDHYQMNTYLHVFDLKRGLLISPLFEGTQKSVREYRTAGGVVIRELFLPMKDLKATEEILGSLVDHYS